MKTVYVLGNVNPLAELCQENKSEVVLKKQFVQKSVFTFSKPGFNNLPVVKKYKNEWMADQCYAELSKKYVSEILDSPSDYLVFDALGSIIPIREIICNDTVCEITYSDNMKTICGDLEGKRKISVGTANLFLTEKEMTSRIIDFCKRLTEVYDQKQIVIHKANYVRYFMQEDKIVSRSDEFVLSRQGNKDLINFIYNVILSCLPNANYIDMPEFIASVSDMQNFIYSKEYMRYLVQSTLLFIDKNLAQAQLFADYNIGRKI